jgi:NADH-quinone oxidoreductase subunit L
MTWPLKVLAIGAAIIGFIGLPALFAVTNWFHYWLSPVVERGRLLSTETHTIHTLSETGWAHHHGAEAGVMFASVIVSLAGLGLARRYYRSEVSPKVKALVAYFPRLTRLVANKYYVDEIYHAIILRPIQKTAFILWRFIDVFLIDLMLANWCSIWLIDAAGRISRRLQDGNTQRYLAGLIAGLVLMIIYVASPPNTFVIRPDRRVKVGESVIFDARQAGTDEARILEYQWDFDGDGKWDTVWSSRSVATHVYQQKKIYQVQLQVRDQRWHTIARSLQSVEVE